jgi:hypothetical protein
MINDLDTHERLHYQSHFCRSFKLIDKMRINSKYRRSTANPKRHVSEPWHQNPSASRSNNNSRPRI